jgi:hypothetical protein
MPWQAWVHFAVIRKLFQYLKPLPKAFIGRYWYVHCHSFLPHSIQFMCSKSIRCWHSISMPVPLQLVHISPPGLRPFKQGLSLAPLQVGTYCIGCGPIYFLFVNMLLNKVYTNTVFISYFHCVHARYSQQGLTKFVKSCMVFFHDFLNCLNSKLMLKIKSNFLPVAFNFKPVFRAVNDGNALHQGYSVLFHF